MLFLGSKLVCLAVLIHVCSSVIVKDGEFTFSLESVKQLKKVLEQPVKLMDKEQPQPGWIKWCRSPEVLNEFTAVCSSPSAEGVFARLERIATNPDVCEVCAMAACSGC